MFTYRPYAVTNIFSSPPQPGVAKSRTLVGIRCLGRRWFVARRHLSRAAGEVGRGSGREGVRCRNLRRDTDIRFTLSLA